MFAAVRSYLSPPKKPEPATELYVPPAPTSFSYREAMAKRKMPPCPLDEYAKAEAGSQGPRARQAAEHGVQALSHQTPCENLAEMLRSGWLRSGETVGKAQYDYEFHEGADKKVYVAATSDNTEYESLDPNRMRQCRLYLSPKLLDDRERYHLSKGWLYGKEDPENSARPSEPRRFARVLDKINDEGRGGTVGQNEVVLQDPVPLRDYLLGVSVPEGATVPGVTDRPRAPRRKKACGTCYPASSFPWLNPVRGDAEKK